MVLLGIPGHETRVAVVKSLVWRPILTYFVTGVFAVLTVAGQSLHLIPGCGHGCCNEVCEAVCEHESHAEGSCPDCGHGPQFRAEHGGSAMCSDADNCQICKHLARVQLLSPTVAADNVLPIVSRLRPSYAAPDAVSEPLSFEARAPPAV
jgi:hypothetical protein